MDTEPERDDLESPRVQARKRVEKRRGLENGTVAYFVINAFLIGVWWTSGAGYFWPGWILAGWGIGMVLGWWDYLRTPITEADVDAELQRLQGKGSP